MAYSIHELAKESLENKVKRITEKLILSSILVVLLNYLILNNLPHSVFCDLTIKQNLISFTLVFHTSYMFFLKISPSLENELLLTTNSLGSKFLHKKDRARDTEKRNLTMVIF